jgi:16S rRNA G966 N2-methylase RsmD
MHSACWPACRPARTDLVFLDPPFDADLFDQALAAARPALSAEGFLYLEAPAEWGGEALARHRLERVRHMKAGAVHGHLLRPAA